MALRSTNEYFCRNTTYLGAAGSDSNDGRDCMGAALTTASYTTATGALNESGAFTNYTFTSGDTIYLDAVGSGTAGLYEILAKNDNDEIDIGIGTYSAGDEASVTSSDGPLLTFGTAFRALWAGGGATDAAGLVMNICADATYAPVASSLAVEGRTGTEDNPFVLRGVQSRGVWDGITRPTISGANLTAGGTLIISNVANSSFVMSDLVLDGGAVTGRRLHQVSGVNRRFSALRVRWTNVGDRGLYLVPTAGDASVFTLIDCEIDDIGTVSSRAGLQVAGSSGVVNVLRCSIHDNGRQGASCDGPTFFQDCVIYDNVTDGIAAVGQLVTASNCTIDRNGGDGIDLTGSGGNVVTNCIISNNGAYGIRAAASSNANRLVFEDSNLFYNNTSGSTDISATQDPVTAENALGNDVYADPLFVSNADGSEDYDTLSGSPAHGAAMQPPEN